jgi:hypothetical protein
MRDTHAEDLMTLIEEYGAADRAAGELRARIALHLQIRTLGVEEPALTAEERTAVQGQARADAGLPVDAVPLAIQGARNCANSKWSATCNSTRTR